MYFFLLRWSKEKGVKVFKDQHLPPDLAKYCLGVEWGRKILKYQKVIEIKMFIPGKDLNTNVQTINMLEKNLRDLWSDNTF